MASPLTFNCLVRGQDQTHIFQVNLLPTQTIADLKEGIKEKKKPVFDHVPADAIVLWNAIISVDNELVTTIESLNLLEGDARSLSLPIMQSHHFYFRSPEYIHVVVQPPPLPVLSTPPAPATIELNCLVLGHPSDRIFPVKIALNESVGSLKYAIKEKKKPAFDHIPADILVLWEASISNRFSQQELEGLCEDNFDHVRSLSPMDRLSKVFSGVPKEGQIHIFVKPPPIDLGSLS